MRMLAITINYFSLININSMSQKKDYVFVAVFLFLLALISPLVLIPVEKYLPYPFIIEEITKAFFVILILGIFSNFFQIKLATFIAFIFSFSESLFYLSNFIEIRDLSGFFQRFFLTACLHILTILIIIIPSQKNRYLLIPALLVAIIVHFYYNQIILTLFR